MIHTIHAWQLDMPIETHIAEQGIWNDWLQVCSAVPLDGYDLYLSALLTSGCTAYLIHTS